MKSSDRTIMAEMLVIRQRISANTATEADYAQLKTLARQLTINRNWTKKESK